MFRYVPALFSKSPAHTDTLSEFIKKLDDLITQEGLEIINGPTSPVAQLYNIIMSPFSTQRQLTRDEVINLLKDMKEEDLPDKQRAIKRKIMSAKNQSDLQKMTLPVISVYEKPIPKGVMDHQNEVKSLLVVLEKMAETISTTSTFIHMTPSSQSYRHPLPVESIREYYKEYGKMIKTRKKATCDSISALGFTLGSHLLATSSRFQGIEIAICSLKNWTHTLLRVSHTDTDGHTKNRFYDGWYQRTYAASAKIPKIFPCEQLGNEMKFLIKKASGIKHNDKLYDSNSRKIVVNKQQNYAYYVLCSTGAFDNPSPLVSDPSVENALDDEVGICPKIRCHIL